ncbi:S8 family serine peptidase [Pontibacter cellulosilyticus]|uniref:S8 family serine peptidase n=1 Tax=Pontibacter cellulosilyticus TaxID=1720253 RepID=A0A923N618_9BACT|nr:S8 family serine peptidase [Pontibacter cellulosilyticus]MBC5992474.1 S8 family serine peptidase [Pontibacter cellulosilyticus]
MFTDYPMLRRIFIFALTFLFATYSYQVYAQQRQPLGAETKPYTLVYKLKQQPENGRVSDAPLQAALQKIGAKATKRKFPDAAVQPLSRRATAPEIARIFELNYSSEIGFEKARNVLMASGLVEYVEPLYERVPFHQPNDPAADSTLTTQYYLKLISAYQAWGVEKGDTNVIIGILDTGFRLTHQDLKAKVKRNYNDLIDGKDNDGDGYIDNYEGWDFADSDNNPFDDTRFNGHGTNVAGVAVAAANNSTGMAGVGYNIKFMPLKVFTSTSSGGFGGYEAIVYAANKGCSVINLSWGGEGYSKYEQDIINYAVLERNAVIVASGGNTAGNINFYPASYDNVISVGGTDASDIKHSTYTHSYNIDLTAPSRNVYTTSHASDSAYGGANGTSFASPLVAACAALVRSRYPELNARQVIEHLRVSSDDIYTIAQNQPYLEMLGKGRVNLKRAIKQQGLKSTRCTKFEIVGSYAPPAGATAHIKADFINFLAPTSALEVTLSSPSPYITVTKNKVTLGAIGTMASISAGSQPTFTFEIAENAPANHQVVFRLGYKDGSYDDFQNFVLKVNPDFITLDVNNLKVTLNSKGNLGYNGFKFGEGDGVTYKGSNPMLFEGGLIVAASNNRVSDNLRSKMWENDGDFIPTSITKRHLNTPLATQEVRHVMHDNHNTPNELNVGVQVKQIAYAWNTTGHQDYIVLEYHIKNTSTETFEKLHAGLFADWDVGEYYLNAANWDSETQLGYVHHVSAKLPYVGIKLLSDKNPSYYAIDNIGAQDDDLTIEDNFTSEEKYKTLSNGIARKTAGTAYGNNVSHVVGAAVNKLAPGETKIVAFALLAADNLSGLKANALAAQQKYTSFRTSQLPVALADTACADKDVTWVPQGGTKFNFYADQQKTTPLGSGPSYTLKELKSKTTIYAAGADSVFESAAVPGTFSLSMTPVADFEVQGDIFAGTPVTFINKSKNASSWRWDFDSVQPFMEKDLTYTFEKPGNYEITLTVTDRQSCSEVSVTKVVEVKAANPTAIPNALAGQLQVYPNPTTGLLHLKLDNNGARQKLPEVALTDMVGKTVRVPVAGNADAAVTDLSDLAAGVYLARISYDGVSVVKRIVIMKP